MPSALQHRVLHDSVPSLPSLLSDTLLIPTIEETLAVAIHSNEIATQGQQSIQNCAGPLTKRQIQCVSLAGQGKTDWEIGVILGISEETVKRHISEARRHYDVAKRVQVVIRALADGLVSIGELIGGQCEGQTSPS